jgi:hypothetical protein
MRLFAEAQELTSKKTTAEYKSWCNDRISLLSERILNHARRGLHEVIINDSKYTADEVYKYFTKEGFTISEIGREKRGDWYYPCWNKWDGRKPLEEKQVKISWEN